MEMTNSRYIGELFKKEIQRQRYRYDEVAEALGVAGKQNVYFRLNRMFDKGWTFLEVADLCDMLHIDIKELADSVRRRRGSD